ncbi:MAG: DUF3316 domain-containing protein [Paludibacteraceae bacterium]|nr:DUF3316 domain-containing protein [Paludibacteraceae bacterium]
MRKFSFLISFFFFFLTTLHAETSDSASVRLGNRAFGLGIGRETHHVSFLSPLLYSGTTYEFWNETIKHQSVGKGDFYSLVNNRVSMTYMMPTNESTEMSSYYDVFEYHNFYDWKLTPNFHMLCGVYAGFEFGADLLFSNSNNPVYIRADLSLLGLSFRPTLCLRTRRRLIKISDQLNLRLAGVVFSPTYTQLYYDLTLEEYDKSEFIDFNSLSEKVRFSNKLMVELPLRKTTLRLGMLFERSKSMINMIDNRTLNVQALIGWSYDYYNLKGRLNRDSRFTTVFE